jgi:hypothetical protein
MMKRLLALFSALCPSPSTGFLVALMAFITMTDLAATQANIPAQLGLRWQAEVVSATPLLCVIGCLIGFSLWPKGNRSKYALIRGIGRIPAGIRCLIFVGIMCGIMLLQAILLFSSLMRIEPLIPNP